MRRWGHGSPSSVGWRFRWVDLGWGPLTWLAAVGCQLVMYGVVVLFHIPLSSNVEDVSDPDITRLYQILTVLAAVVAAPVVEELVFRGLIMRGFLSRMGADAGDCAARLAVRLRPLRSDTWRRATSDWALVLSAVGVALGTSAYLLRRIGPTIIAHTIFNGVVLVIILSGLIDDADKELGHLAAMLAVLPWC